MKSKAANFRAHIVQLREGHLKGMTRSASIGYALRRMCGTSELIERLRSNPDGSPADFDAAVDTLEAYGQWVIEFAQIMRDKPVDPPVMVPLKKLR